MPKFSIIVPVYNVEAYIEECICSVLNQSCEDFELILIDDGSPDRCPEICDSYAKKDKRIKVIHKSNGGLSEARNVGIKESVGEYILFLDSDDTLKSEDALEGLLPYAQNEYDIVFGHMNGRIDNKYIPEEKEYVDTGEKMILLLLRTGKLTVTVWNKIYRAEYIKKRQLYFVEGYVHEDNEWTGKTVAAASKCILTKAEFYMHRIVENSIITNNSEKNRAYKAKSKIVLASYACKEIKKYTSHPEALHELYTWYMGLFLDGMVSYHWLKDKQQKAEIKGVIEQYSNIFGFGKELDNKKYQIFYYLNKIFGINSVLIILRLKYRRAPAEFE